MFNEIFKHKILDCDNNVSVYGIDKNVSPNYIWSLFCVSKKNILVITNTLYEANNLYKMLQIISENNVFFFPMDDFLVSEALAISPDLMAKRIETLNELTQKKDKKIIITNLMGYLRYLPSKKLWESSFLNIKKGDLINKEDLIKKLNMIGYKKESIVTKTGEFASRGYILDIFAYGYENPVRIEFFDNEVDEIRLFDENNQLSMKKINNIEIYPFTEFINEKEIDDIIPRQSMLSKVVNEISMLSNYIEDKIDVFINLDSIKISYNKLLEDIIEFKNNDNIKIDNYMHNLYDIIPKKYIDISDTDNYINTSNCELYKINLIDNFNGNYKLINSFLEKNKSKKIIVCLKKDKAIADFLANINYKAVITDINNIFENTVNIIKIDISSGFIINDMCIISQNELYKRNNVLLYKSKFKYGSKIKDVNKLSIGDYVVHSSFGIGRYNGLKTLTVKGIKKDFIDVSYKGNDKLYIPVEKIEYLYKYSSNEGMVPTLSKLGGTDWVKQKIRVKSKVKDIAKELIEIYAKRKMSKGFAFLEDDEEQYKFEENFEYTETKDQLRVIKEIKEDMESVSPMDRLLCGDVGFGKTEVAFRAIFKAIKSGKQVAYLCPTTILAKQHYENAKIRFEGFGINIALLNRFTKDKEKREIIENLKNGKLDFIIGTHRLLSGDLEYKDLGLLVIDEEQRFGVTHKEKIKKLKENIDVLSLSATPIPRTLQLSLTGIRGLSLIETPPLYRYPVQTYVLRENDQIIKDAIYKELARNGQIFILYNNILKIEDKLSHLKKLVPEAKFNYIHGRMQKDKIEVTMEQFVNKEFDCLLCTTIIETGIDIQNANTLIIFDADHFGLSQLYQIRGRIGRGKNIGYAYLMYQKNKELNDIAVKRLNAIKEFTELGSGYALAVRDLSIRGAGDILGAEQSGFIDSVGYDMYLKILNEEVEMLKGNNIIEDEDRIEEKPFIQVETHISDNYELDDDLKIQIHKKINTITTTKKYLEVKKELEDRFGRLDESINIYMLEELFQAKAKEKGIIKVDQTDSNIKLYFSIIKSETIDVTDFMAKLFKISSNFNVSYKTKQLIVDLNLKDLNEHFMYYLIKMIDIIE